MFGEWRKKNIKVMSPVQFTNTAFPTTPQANIPHLKIIDQDSKQVAREAREAIHIRINKPALNHNPEKLYVPEIFNHLLGADGSSNVIDSDLPQYHAHLALQSNKFFRVVCLAN